VAETRQCVLAGFDTAAGHSVLLADSDFPAAGRQMAGASQTVMPGTDNDSIHHFCFTFAYFLSLIANAYKLV
jgi:hypothetical protein